MFLAQDRFETIKDQFGVSQIRCVKAFSKLGVDRLQQLQRFVRAAFASPERGKIARRAQLPATGLLAPRDLQASGEQNLDLIACALGCAQQACLDAQDLGQTPALACLLGDNDCLFNRVQRGLVAACFVVSLGLKRQKDG